MAVDSSKSIGTLLLFVITNDRFPRSANHGISLCAYQHTRTGPNQCMWTGQEAVFNFIFEIVRNFLFTNLPEWVCGFFTHLAYM